jgi:hypothetical protein
MLENETLDPPEDAPVLNADTEETLRERVEDARGHAASDEELATMRREQGPPEK